MTDQKTPLEPKENKTSARSQKPAQPFDHRVRLWVADMQCRVVRLRHHLHKNTKAQKRASLRRLRAWPVYNFIGEGLYSLGFQGEYAAVRFARFCRSSAVRLSRLCGRIAGHIGVQLGRFGHMLKEDLITPIATFVRGVVHIFQYAHQVRKEKGFGKALWEGLCYLGRGIRLYAKLVPHTITYVVPIVTGILCVLYIHQQFDVGYLLAVQVNGGTVGYVQSENVFESAKTAVDQRINYAGTSQTSWNITPTYTLARDTGMRHVLDENQMADAILRTSGDEISEGTALYIDGQLCRVTTSGQQLRDYLDGLKAPYATDDENTVVRFNHDVELVDGIFFNDSFSDLQAIVDYVSSDEVNQVNYSIVAGDSISLIASKNNLTQDELFALNPGLTEKSKLYPGDQLLVQKQEAVLEVQIQKTFVQQETIPFSTETTESADYSWGTTKTIQEGAEGLKNVTYQVTYDTSGNALDTVVLNTEILQEPVTKQVVKGTKTAMGTIAQVGNGSLMWPVPGYKYCSRWMSNGHKGVDICAGYGTAILAADSGVVVASGYSAAGSGYGNSIVIDHGNGYRTLYGHCSALYVSAGQSVSQGQVIGAVGSTGRSTGNHCHFEILYNGSRVPPQNVFGGYR